MSLARLADAYGLLLPQDGIRRLEVFEGLLLERAVPLGLVAASDAGRIRLRHVGDSLRAVAGVRPDDRLAYDVGSGAGLPGVVVAIACPDLSVRLIEPRRTRVAFLELVVETLGIANASVVQGRIEDATESADVCFARAFAPQQEAWGLVRRLLRPGGRLVYFAGAQGAEPSAGGRGVPGSHNAKTGTPSSTPGRASPGTIPGTVPRATDPDRNVPPPSSVEVLPAVLESAGSLIIMTR